MPSAKASEAATAAPSRIANPPTRGYACEASMAGTGRQRPAFPNTGYSRAKRLLAYFAARGISLQGKQPAVPGRVILRPFMPIKLKKAPPGLAPRFPSEIRTAQAAIKFVNSLDPKTRAKLHWKLAASALAALDIGAIRQGACDRANRQCATLWRLNAGWPTEVGEASHANSRLRADTRGRGVCAGGGTPQAQLCPVSGATRKSFARSGFYRF